MGSLAEGRRVPAWCPPGITSTRVLSTRSTCRRPTSITRCRRNSDEPQLQVAVEILTRRWLRFPGACVVHACSCAWFGTRITHYGKHITHRFGAVECGGSEGTLRVCVGHVVEVSRHLRASIILVRWCTDELLILISSLLRVLRIGDPPGRAPGVRPQAHPGRLRSYTRSPEMRRVHKARIKAQLSADVTRAADRTRRANA